MAYPRMAPHTLIRSLIICVISTFTIVSNSRGQAAPPLSAYNVEPSTVTVAGISSGGFLAVQLQVAYSKRIFGTAIFAGGPYYCAQDSITTAQGYCESGNGIPLQALIDYTNGQASGGTIDPTSNIANKPIYMFSGFNDTTVHQPVMNTLQQYYETYTNSNNITYNNNSPAAHAWISPDGPNSCNSSYIPYINNCGIDPEQTFLSMFYGTLNPKNTGSVAGRYVQFDQNAFVSGGNANSYSMDSTGWLFVPANCANGHACRLVVALHGCLQYQGIVQQQFVQKSGINEWADTNNIIVLYPQTIASSPNNPSYTDGGLSASTTYSYTVSALNSSGESAQSMAVSATTLGASGIPAVPNGLTVSGTTTSSVSLTWSASAQAVAYNVYRNGNKVGSSGSTSYIDSGLSGGSTYIYAVTAVNSSGESAKSQTVTAGTQPQAVTAPVAQHYADGHLSLAQFLQLGQKYGYVTPITLYLCGSTWTNSSTCGPIQ